MKLETYLEEDNELTPEELKLSPILKKLLHIITDQSKLDSLLEIMENKKDWEKKSLVIELSNYKDVLSVFKDFSESYCNNLLGRVDKIIRPFICSRTDTKPGECIIGYKKDKDYIYEYDDNCTSSKEVKNLHPNHSLIFVVETNNKVFNKPDETAYGKGIKYLIYIYLPSSDSILREHCFCIKRKKEKLNAPVIKKISAATKKHNSKIDELKKQLV